MPPLLLAPKSSLRKLLVIAGLALAGLAAGRAAEVSREASAAYREKLAPLLTPRQEAIRDSLKEVEKDAPGVTLLEETLHYVDAQGRRMMVEQSVYKALTEAGAKAAAEDVQTYRKHWQKFAVLVAETIQPDGTVQAVGRDAILMQSPQRQASYALYDDQAEVRTIFPNVKAGSIVRLVFVIEDVEARMPNEYTSVFTWTTGWPKRRLRHVVDLPDVLANRLQVLTMAQTPQPVRDVPAKGRVRLSWQMQDLPMGNRDISPAPASQFGPSVHLTTVAQWADVGRWFNGMVAGRDKLSSELVKKVDDWTKGAGSPAEVRRILFSKVADDVRYTGLELGAADYQPHDCNEVWANQYGDCKDKANLLAAMLRHKGQEAYVTLLNTTHAGVVDQRAPDYRPFSHAIVAVREESGGKFLFCDPTLGHAVPGMLAGSDLDRDVLVIKQRDVEWARTPAQSAGTADYRFDLNLKPSGELSGWLTFTSSGYFGAYYIDAYQKYDAIEGKQSMQAMLREFYPGADLIDFVKPANASASEPYVLKVYFTIRNPSENGTGTHTLVFPKCQSWVPGLGNTPERQTPYFQYAEQVNVSCRIRLAPGLAPAALPPAYGSETPGAKFDAHWSFGGELCTGELSMTLTRTLVQASDFSVYYQSVQGLSAWMEKPVVLGAASDRPVVATTYSLSEDFPLMPSSDGQFALLEKLFPNNSNAANRRAALERILQYFPNDKSAAFRAGVLLALADADSGQRSAAAARLHLLNSTYKNDVRADVFAWGQGIEAFVRGQLGEFDAVQKILAGLAADSALPEDFRAQQFLYCADSLKSHPQREMAEALQTAAHWNTRLRPQIFVLWAQVALQLDQAARCREALAEIVKTGAAGARDLFLQIAREARWVSVAGDAARQKIILGLLAEFGPQLGDAYRADLAKLREVAEASQRIPEIQAKLKASLAAPPLADFFKPAETGLQNNQDFERELTLAEGRQDFDRYLQLCLQQLTSVAPDDYFGQRLLRAAFSADFYARRLSTPAAEAMITCLLDLGRELPDDLPAYHELALLRGAVFNRQGKFAEEQALYRQLLANPNLQNNARLRVTLVLGKSLETTGALAPALEVYAALEKNSAVSPEAASALFRAVFLQLHYFRYDDAERLVRRLAEIDRSVRAKAEGAKSLEELIELVAANQAKPYWRQLGAWWPSWENLAKSVDAPGAENPVPVIADQRAWSQALGEEIRRGDLRAIYEKLGTIASATRWLPSMSLELGDFIQLLVSSDPKHSLDAVKLGALVFGTEVEGPPELVYSRKLQLAACLIQSQQANQAGVVIAGMRKLPPPKNPRLVQAFNRVQASCATATGHGRKEASEALAADLAADSNSYFLRTYGVGVLVDLYHAMNKLDAERALIVREIDHPEIKANQPLHNMLTARLAELKNPPATFLNANKLPAKIGNFRDGNVQTDFKPGNSDPTDPLSGSIQDVANRKQKPATAPVVPAAPAPNAIKDYLPDWFDYVGPKNLSDPRIRQLGDVLAQPGRYFEPQEVLKFLMLVAADPQQPAGVRNWGATYALQQLQRQQLEPKVRAHTADLILEDTRLDVSVRQAVFFDELLCAAEEGAQDAVMALLKRLPADSFNFEQQADREFLVRWAGLKPATSPALVELGRDIAAAGLSVFRADMLQHIGYELALRGEVESLRNLAKSLDGTVPAASQGAPTPETLQLQLGQEVAKLEAHLPVQRALAEALLARFPQAPATPPAEYAKFGRYRGILIVTSPAPTFEHLLSLLRADRYERGNFLLWHHLWRGLPRDEKSNQLALDLVEQGLSHAPSDEVRAELVSVVVSALDWDNPAVRQGLNERLAAYRKADQPLTQAEIRFYEIYADLRCGDPVDLENAFVGLESPDLARVRLRIRLLQYIVAGDKMRLRRELAAVEAGLLSEPTMLPLTLRAYELLGLNTEADQVRSMIRRAIYRAVSRAWVFHDTVSAVWAGNLADALQTKDALPDAWLQGFAASLPDEVARRRVVTVDAKIRQDWPRLLLAAEGTLALQPTNYRYFWFKGLALARLGRKSEAKEALEIYTKYARDEIEYPEAKVLLGELTK